MIQAANDVDNHCDDSYDDDKHGDIIVVNYCFSLGSFLRFPFIGNIFIIIMERLLDNVPPLSNLRQYYTCVRPAKRTHSFDLRVSYHQIQ